MERTNTWDIFCKVIDNFGDIGVCWRLACNLAERGLQVRLWVDDASALAWMAPTGCAGVQVRGWNALSPQLPELSQLPQLPQLSQALHLGADSPGDVVVAAFGCDVAPQFIAACAIAASAAGTMGTMGTIGTMGTMGSTGQSTPQKASETPLASASGVHTPICINLEYLSAEAFVQRNHGLPSPALHGPTQGMTTWFYYPGFTAQTGGLMREAGLMERLCQFDAGAWLRRLQVQELGPGLAVQGPLHGSGHDGHHDRTQSRAAAQQLVATHEAVTTQHISLFCYESPALPQLLSQLAHSNSSLGDQLNCPLFTQLIVTAGRAQHGVLAAIKDKNAYDPLWNMREQLSISYLAPVSQAEFDHLLWACDLNFVRGEDSLVRALWAGKPFIWHIYPQDDGAHRAKLEAFLDWLDAPADLRDFHRVWNGLSPAALPPLNLKRWAQCAQAARQRLLLQTDLCTQLLDFVEQKRNVAV